VRRTKKRPVEHQGRCGCTGGKGNKEEGNIKKSHPEGRKSFYEEEKGFLTGKPLNRSWVWGKEPHQKNRRGRKEEGPSTILGAGPEPSWTRKAGGGREGVEKVDLHMGKAAYLVQGRHDGRGRKTGRRGTSPELRPRGRLGSRMCMGARTGAEQEKRLSGARSENDPNRRKPIHPYIRTEV